MPQREQVFSDALALPPTERAALAEELLSSFDAASRQALDLLWAKEAEDRIDAFDHGDMGSVSAQEVFARLGR